MSLTFTAVKPGIIGNLIVVQMISSGSGPAASAVVTDLGINQFQIDITYNNTATSTAMATALSSDSAVTDLVTVVGEDSTTVSPGYLRLTGGTTGQG